MNAAATDDRTARRQAREKSLRAWLVALLAYTLPESDAEAVSTAPQAGELRVRLYDGRSYLVQVTATEEGPE